MHKYSLEVAFTQLSAQKTSLSHVQESEDKARFHASGVWCSHTMWGKIQRVLEERLEKMESLKFDTVQLRSANHRAMEDNRMQSILTEQQLSSAQRECDIKVRH